MTTESKQNSIFKEETVNLKKLKKVPLSELLRPIDLSELEGKSNINISVENPQSLILWGPAGSGKTSLAKIISSGSKIKSATLSAVTCGSADFKEVFKMAEYEKILLLVDEIHHLNKSQQDIFLPHIENGNIILIGTTTENPSFELRPALLSRCRVVTFERLSEKSLENLIEKAEVYISKKLNISVEARKTLCKIADGDGRYLLNRVEEIFELNPENELSSEELCKILNNKPAIYDKNSDSHYNLISAFHKSIRGSDPNAALYWFARMLEGGEDPMYIIRRLIRCASEEVGLSDPNALTQAINAKEAYKLLGSPEGELSIAQAIIYVATAPKSNSAYVAYNSARKLAKMSGSLQPPKHILNAPTKFMEEQGFNKGYIYDHNTKEVFSGQNYFPEELPRQNLYSPSNRGFEKEIQKRLDWWDEIRKKKCFT